MRYTYDAAGHLVVVTDALHQALRYAYRADHLLVQKTFRTGVSFYFEYAGAGSSAQCVRTWGDDNVLNGRLLFEPGRTIAYSDTPGDESSYEHTDGLLTRHTDPLGAVREYSYKRYGDLVLERDPLGQATSYTYDARGNQTRVVYPDGAKVHTQYNALDLPIQVTDANGGMWHYSYDKAGNVLAQTNPLGVVASCAYDEQGRLVAATDAAGLSTRLHYNGHQPLERLIDPAGHSSFYRYDALGRLVHLVDAQGNVRERHYDALGRVVAVRDPAGGGRTFAYDGEANLLHVQGAQRTVTFTYSALDQLATRTEGETQVQFTYDAAGRLLSLRNEHGETYRWERDAAGQVIIERGFDGLMRRYQRDAAGRVMTLLRPAERMTTYAYDPMGRLLEVAYSDGTQARFAYRADGELLEASTPDHTPRPAPFYGRRYRHYPRTGRQCRSAASRQLARPLHAGCVRAGSVAAVGGGPSTVAVRRAGPSRPAAPAYGCWQQPPLSASLLITGWYCIAYNALIANILCLSSCSFTYSSCRHSTNTVSSGC